MKKLMYLLICLLLSGCVQDDDQLPLTKKARISKEYLEDKGYVILTYEGEETKTYTKSDLTKLPHKQDWAVQTIEPDPYLNKEIHLVHFFVKGHPLDDEFQGGKTSVTVMMWNEEVIGGTSYPYSKHNDLLGGSYSLDGETSEENQSKQAYDIDTELIKMKYKFLEYKLINQEI